MPLYRNHTDSSIPDKVVPVSRFGANPPRISNTLSAGAEVSISAQTMLVFPIFIPSQISSNTLQIRTSGSTSIWPNASSIAYSTRWYDSGVDGLPASAKTPTNTTNFAVGTTTNTWVTCGSGFGVFERGVYWLGIAAHSSGFGIASNFSGYTSSFEHILFNKIVGIGATQTSDARCLSTAIDGAFVIPDDLSGRLLDMTFAAASQTTLRLRSSAPAIWLSYN
jgi:hypothetical protein